MKNSAVTGGSAAVPEGEVVVRLYDGAIGPTYLAQAQAEASLNATQQLSFSADLAPAEAGRHSGHVRVSGSVPLRPAASVPAGDCCYSDCLCLRRPQSQPVTTLLALSIQCLSCASCCIVALAVIFIAERTMRSHILKTQQRGCCHG